MTIWSPLDQQKPASPQNSWQHILDGIQRSRQKASIKLPYQKTMNCRVATRDRINSDTGDLVKGNVVTQKRQTKSSILQTCSWYGFGASGALNIHDPPNTWWIWPKFSKEEMVFPWWVFLWGHNGFSWQLWVCDSQCQSHTPSPWQVQIALYQQIPTNSFW